MPAEPLVGPHYSADQLDQLASDFNGLSATGEPLTPPYSSASSAHSLASVGSGQSLFLKPGHAHAGHGAHAGQGVAGHSAAANGSGHGHSHGPPPGAGHSHSGSHGSLAAHPGASLYDPAMLTPLGTPSSAPGQHAGTPGAFYFAPAGSGQGHHRSHSYTAADTARLSLDTLSAHGGASSGSALNGPVASHAGAHAGAHAGYAQFAPQQTPQQAPSPAVAALSLGQPLQPLGQPLGQPLTHRPRALSSGVFDMFDSFDTWQPARLRSAAAAATPGTAPGTPGASLLASPFAVGHSNLAAAPEAARPPLARRASGFSAGSVRGFAPFTPPADADRAGLPFAPQVGAPAAPPGGSATAGAGASTGNSAVAAPNGFGHARSLSHPGVPLHARSRSQSRVRYSPEAAPPAAASATPQASSSVVAAAASTPAPAPAPASSLRRGSTSSVGSVGPRAAAAADVFSLSDDEILQLCKDQRGCRALQKRLQEQDAAVVDRIFAATAAHMTVLMMDPFGNYFCQRLVESCSQAQLAQIVATVQPAMVEIAVNQHGTRALQKMIDALRTDEQVALLVAALRGHVVRLIRDLNGNHVIQKCLVDLDERGSQFIYDAVEDNVVEVGSHRHGCCVLQRCIDHASERNRGELVSRIVAATLDLVRDPFGNYVCQYVIDLKNPAYTEALAARLVGSVSALSVQKFSSNVVEKCLWMASPPLQERLVRELLEPRTLHRLLLDSFGNYVIQTALDSSRGLPRHAALVAAVQEALASTPTPYGRRIMSKLRKG